MGGGEGDVVVDHGGEDALAGEESRATLEDLFDRLSLLIVEWPPLRACREDLHEDFRQVWIQECADKQVMGQEPPDDARLWAALQNPNAADVLLSLAPDWECEDWGGVTHTPGGSHGSLRAEDSLGTLLTVGLEGERPEHAQGAGGEQWAISDVAELVDRHFGIASLRSIG